MYIDTKYQRLNRYALRNSLKVKFYKIIILICAVASACLAFKLLEVYTLSFISPAEAISIPEKVKPEVRKPAVKPDIKDYIWEQAKKRGLDPVSIFAIIQCESGFNPNAWNANTNRTLDLGIAQINSIHKDISLKDRLDPYKSIDWMLNKRIKDGSYRAWVCANKLGIK